MRSFSPACTTLWKTRVAGSDACVAALVAGTACLDLSGNETAAQRVTQALVADRDVSDETYHDALRRFGEKGLVDLVILAGCYQLVCGVLTLFAVPAPRSPCSTEEA